MTRSRVWLVVAVVIVLLALAGLVVRLLVWDATRPSPGVEGSAASAAAASWSTSTPSAWLAVQL